MNPPPDRAVDALARAQHGVFSRAQALAAGASTGMIQRRLEAGRWIRLDQAVYALPGNPPTWHRQLKAAELAIPGAAISGRAAAALLGLPGYRRGRPEISVPRSARGGTALAVVRRRSGLLLTRVERIRVTTAEQTICDLARGLTPAEMKALLTGANAAGLVNMQQLAARIDPAAGLRSQGIPALRLVVSELMGDGDEVKRSVLEAAFREMILRSGVTGVVYEFPAPWSAEGTQRVDAALPAAGILLEADSRRWHTRVADFQKDRWRTSRRPDWDGCRCASRTTIAPPASRSRPPCSVRRLIGGWQAVRGRAEATHRKVLRV